jgi:hypothetical protein
MEMVRSFKCWARIKESVGASGEKASAKNVIAYNRNRKGLCSKGPMVG